MPTPKITSAEATRKRSREICANSPDVQRKVLDFDNEDVPKYLENLRKFEKKSLEARSKYVVK